MLGRRKDRKHHAHFLERETKGQRACMTPPSPHPTLGCQFSAAWTGAHCAACWEASEMKVPGPTLRKTTGEMHVYGEL